MRNCSAFNSAFAMRSADAARSRFSWVSRIFPEMAIPTEQTTPTASAPAPNQLHQKEPVVCCHWRPPSSARSISGSGRSLTAAPHGGLLPATPALGTTSGVVGHRATARGDPEMVEILRPGVHIDPNDKKPAFRNRIFMEGGASEADISNRASRGTLQDYAFDPDPRARS